MTNLVILKLVDLDLGGETSEVELELTIEIGHLPVLVDHKGF